MKLVLDHSEALALLYEGIKSATGIEATNITVDLGDGAVEDFEALIKGLIVEFGK